MGSLLGMMPSAVKVKNSVEEAVREQTAALRESTAGIQTSITEAVAGLRGSMSAQQAVLDRSLAMVREGMARDRSYEFIVKRNKDGLIESVLAKPATMIGR